MNDKKDSEKLIDELIKKRKAETEAFIKLLDAIENRRSHCIKNAQSMCRARDNSANAD